MSANEPLIRPAARGDLKACADIVNAHIDALAWLPRIMDRETVEAAFLAAFQNGRVMRVADLEGVIVGYSSAEPRAPRPALLHALYLRPHMRGRGIGRRLLDRVKADFPDGFELTVFAPNDGARRFYEREGLVEDPARYEEETQEGVPTHLMAWHGAGGSLPR